MLTILNKMAKARDFEGVASLIITGFAENSVSHQSRFRYTFGISSRVCSMIWNLLVTSESIERNQGKIHLLWCLFYLKNYPTEAVGATVCNCSDRTFRKFVWKFIEKIGDLIVVSFSFSFY